MDNEEVVCEDDKLEMTIQKSQLEKDCDDNVAESMQRQPKAVVHLLEAKGVHPAEIPIDHQGLGTT